MRARIEIDASKSFTLRPHHGLLDQLLALAVVAVEVFDDGFPEQTLDD